MLLRDGIGFIGSYRRALGRGACLLIVAGIVLGVAGRADAAIPPELRPGTRPWFATFGIGPAIKINDISSHFKLAQDIGFHFNGGTEGPALGFSLAESFGDNSFGFQLGPKFWWDIQPIPSLGLYIAPMAQVGYALFNWDRGRFLDDQTMSFFDLQFGFELRLIINNRGLVYYRPMTIDVFAGDVVGARYDMMFGGGVVF